MECLACFVRLKEKVREEGVGCRREILEGLARSIHWRRPIQKCSLYLKGK